MAYTGVICFLASFLAFINWKFNVEDFAGHTHLPPALEAAQFIFLYFIVNALCCLYAYDLISKLRIRWHTTPLRRVMAAGIFLHIFGGIGYGLGLAYEQPYVAGLVVLTFAQILCFIGPAAHRRVGFHSRLRRRVRAESGHGRANLDWPSRH